MRTIRKIIIHCAATKPSQDIGATEIRDWHMRGNGWADIGYHWVIRRSGAIEIGRDESRAGAHAAGHNSDSIGICLVGGLDSSGKPAPDFTSGQWASLKRKLEQIKARHPQAEVMGHRDLPGVAKACPSFDVRAWMRTGEIKP